MPTSHPLHPIAAAWLSQLSSDLERDFGRTDSERKILNAVVYGVTPAQVLGMLEAFGKDRRSYNDAYKGMPGDDERGVGGR